MMAHLTRDAGATDAFEVPASQMGLVDMAFHRQTVRAAIFQSNPVKGKTH